MTTVLCPNDLVGVEIQNDGMGECLVCHSTLIIMAYTYRFGCDHIPRPLRGQYLFGVRTISYEFCSMACKEAAEMDYPPEVKDLGLT